MPLPEAVRSIKIAAESSVEVFMLPDLLIETERLIIITIFNESSGDKINYAILKTGILTKDSITANAFLENSERYTVIGHINIDPNTYIEYEVYKQYRNQGFATEMLNAVKEFCLAYGLQPKLYIDSNNTISKKTAANSGFSPRNRPGTKSSGGAKMYEKWEMDK